MTQRGLSTLYFKLPRFIHVIGVGNFMFISSRGTQATSSIEDVKRRERNINLTHSHEFDSCHGVINLFDYSNTMIDSFFVVKLNQHKIIDLEIHIQNDHIVFIKIFFRFSKGFVRNGNIFYVIFAANLPVFL
ncbi:hypothetical protein HHI36_022297 [Cryptolaemus montrouzieri]|uniref:Uncharacterized protein n=1 Tax=Cryptolaemus montrouzieri TaxID=559131 RepID=A0ABD2N083_9CUCU